MLLAATPFFQLKMRFVVVVVVFQLLKSPVRNWVLGMVVIL